MSQDIAETPAAVAEAVIKELEASQVAEPTEEPKPKAEEPKVEVPEAEPTQAEPKEEKLEKAERPERKSQFVPIKKANEWRHEANENKAKVAELEAKLAAAQAAQEQSRASDLELIAKEVAGEDASPEVVKRILEATKKLAPSEDLQAVKALKQKLEEQHEEQAFNRDLNNTLAKFPELKGHEAELRELAYAEGNEKVPLRLLAYQLRDDLNLSPAPPSAEGKSAKPQAQEEPDYANVTEKDIANFSDAQLDKFIEWQQKGLSKRTGIRIH